MLYYVVHVYIEEAVATRWLDWMTSVHVPDVLRTRCFDSARLSQLLEPVRPGYKAYQVQYVTTSADRLEEYRQRHAAHLQDEHTQKFAGRFVASRYVYRDL